MPVRLMMNKSVCEIFSVRAVSAISCNISSKRSTFSSVAPLSSDRLPSSNFKRVTLPIPRAGSLMTRERSAMLSRFSAKRKNESTSLTSLRSKNFVPSNWYGTLKFKKASSSTRDWKLVR